MNELLLNEDYVPCLVDDAEVIEVDRFIGSSTDYLIASRNRNRSMKIKSSNLALFEEFVSDMKNAKDIRFLTDKYNDKFDVLAIIRMLYKNGLLKDYTGDIMSEVELTAKNILKVPLEKISNSKKARFFAKIALNVFRVLFSLTVAAIIVAAFYKGANILDYLKADMSSSVELLGFVALMWLARYFFILFHEAGHVIYALANGVEVDSFNISLKMGVRFAYYIRYRGLFYNKARTKFSLMLSGVTVNLFLAFLFLFLNLLFDRGIFTLFFYVNLMSFISNLYPYKMSDGYFACLILFNKSNIRFKAIKNLFSKSKSDDAKVNILSLVYAGLLVFDVVVIVGVLISLLGFLPGELGINAEIFNGAVIAVVILIKCLFVINAYKKANSGV